jgi:peptide-methionine (S)-S-oxide reductase
MIIMNNNQMATLGGGCFWCIEAIFQRVEGVNSVVSGYSGGNTENPTMEEIYGGDTHHAEVIQLTFDPNIISYKDLLEIFFVMHDPTTLNRQGNDIGEEYRSIIFYHNDDQKKVAESSTKNFAAKLWKDPIVTEVVPYKKFWPAEENQQNFFNNNSQVGYCQVIINPKVQKLRQEFSSKLKAV